MADIPPDVLRNREQLKLWIEQNQGGQVSAIGADVPAGNFSHLNLVSATFAHARLYAANFTGSDLTGAGFANAQLPAADFRESILSNTNFTGANLTGAKLTKISRGHKIVIPFDSWLNFASATLVEVQARAAHLTNSNFNGADLSGANLGKAFLDSSDLARSTLLGADLRGARLRGSDLTGTKWKRARIDRRTDFQDTVWRKEHDATNDEYDRLALSKGQKVFSWNTIRILGEIPLFGSSYVLMFSTVLFVSAIRWLNARQFIAAFKYPIPVPTDTRLLLFGSVLLVIGSTVFRSACPARVKEYSRTRYVQELRQPGVLHVWEGLQKPYLAALTMVCVVVGGAMVSVVFFERLWLALRYAVG